MLLRLTSRKTKETGEVDEDGNPILLSDVEKEGDGGLGDEGLEDGGRVQEPSDAIKAEAGEAVKTPTPKRKRAPAKSKANEAAKAEPNEADESEEKPPINGEGTTEMELAKDEAADAVLVKGKTPPKKRAKKA